MNIKLHTPKSLKKGSGMATMKQFMLSLLATTVSIALTFGTAAVVDKNKKENEKHQILLMVLCDMKTSMDEINEVDSMIGQFVEDQAMYLANPDSFDTSGYLLKWYYTEMDYNRTVENIFNSNIESIYTIGNINFVEKASDFYRMREYYNERVTKLFAKMVTDGITDNYDSLANARATAEEHRFVSAMYARTISQNYRACRMLANVSDTIVNWKIAMASGSSNRTMGTVICYGQGKLTSIQATGQVNQQATYSGTINVYGPITAGTV